MYFTKSAILSHFNVQYELQKYRVPRKRVTNHALVYDFRFQEFSRTIALKEL